MDHMMTFSMENGPPRIHGIHPNDSVWLSWAGLVCGRATHYFITREIGLETHAVSTAIYTTQPRMSKNACWLGLKPIEQTERFGTISKRNEALDEQPQEGGLPDGSITEWARPTLLQSIDICKPTLDTDDTYYRVGSHYNNDWIPTGHYTNTEARPRDDYIRTATHTEKMEFNSQLEESPYDANLTIEDQNASTWTRSQITGTTEH